ncbi:MAG: HD domain-containing protein [archaeon]|jgi:putative hydrolase of HD superfamily|nr:HD domain-containing protein [archaeon]
MSLVEFFETVGKLKGEKRQGWIDRGVKNPESVSDHSFRLSVMALFMAKKLGLDECKAVKLAVIHDLPESICGDTASRIKEELQKIPNSEKKAKEDAALCELCKMLGPKEGAGDLKCLWEEYEEKKSAEAKLVYELDRLEAIFQAIEYEKAGNFEVSLQEFYDFANARIEIPEVRAIFEELMKKRAKSGKSARKH